MNKYIDDRIDNMIFSKLANRIGSIKYYFKNRHTGLAGVEPEGVVELCKGAIRDYRVWNEMYSRNELHKSIRKV